MFEREGAAHKGAVHRDSKGLAFFVRRKRCGRCGGAGGWVGWPGYTCYDCHGAGHLGDERVRLYTAEELEVLNARREKARAKAAAKRAALATKIEAERAETRAVFEAANAELVAGARKYAERSGFLTDLVAKLDAGKVWSDKAMAAVEKTVAELAEYERKAAASEFVGKLKERIERKVKVERVAGYDRPAFGYGGGYEHVNIVTMRDEAGNALVVKSPRFYAEKGDEFVVRGTVKDHFEYKGEKETLLERAKIIEEKVATPS